MSRRWINIMRAVQLLCGVFCLGTGLAFTVRASVGLAPWDVLGHGFVLLTGISFGNITILIGLVAMLLWIPLKEKPGLGTLANVMGTGVTCDLWLGFIPELSWEFIPSVLLLLAGIVTIALGTGLYLGTRLGPGPRDGLMTGLHKILGWPLWLVRTLIEISVLGIGWWLGGQVGIGTIVFSLLIGPLCQIFIILFTVRAYADKDPMFQEKSPTEELPIIS